MNRKDELVILMQSLLGKLNKAIDNNQYSSVTNKIVESAETCVDINKQLEKYLDEYKNLSL